MKTDDNWKKALIWSRDSSLRFEQGDQLSWKTIGEAQREAELPFLEKDSTSLHMHIRMECSDEKVLKGLILMLCWLSK